MFAGVRGTVGLLFPSSDLWKPVCVPTETAACDFLGCDTEHRAEINLG